MDDMNMMVAQEQFNISADINESMASMFCSVDNSTREGQMIIYNAINSPTGRLGDMIGKIINVKDVIAEPTVIYNEEQVPIETIRLTLITDDNKSYTCVSTGIYNAVKKLIAVFGMPTWTDPLPLEIKQILRQSKSGQPRNVLTLQLAQETKKK